MKTATECFGVFSTKKPRLELKMYNATLAARDDMLKEKHVGAGGGFKSFEKALKLLAECSVHRDSYDAEQLGRLKDFVERIKELLFDYDSLIAGETCITLRAVPTLFGYQVCKQEYYKQKNKPDTKSKLRESRVQELQELFEERLANLDPEQKRSSKPYSNI